MLGWVRFRRSYCPRVGPAQTIISTGLTRGPPARPGGQPEFKVPWGQRSSLSTTAYGTYNGFAELASMTDQLGRITTYTYDSHGSMTIEEDALTNVITYTYSSAQPGC